MRKPIVVGNWKMNTTLASARALAEKIGDGLRGVSQVEVGVCPPFVYMAAISEIAKKKGLALGAQNMYHEKAGAFTGEVSPLMLKDFSCDYCILGHSERRSLFGETDEMVNRKLHSCLDAGIAPIFCVGELLSERERGLAKEVVRRQVSKGLEGMAEGDVRRLVFAYEPVWAIGTGRTATASQAQEMHEFIRSLLAEIYSPNLARSVRIQYGGSVKPENTLELMKEPDIDGLLVGGASLDAESFLKIVAHAQAAYEFKLSSQGREGKKRC